MLIEQLAQHRCEVENQYARVVRADGNPLALGAIDATMRAARRLRVARARATSRTAPLRCVRSSRSRRGAALRRCRRARRRSEGLPVRRGAEGRAASLGMQGVRHGVHAGAADRHLHGLERRGLRRLLQLRPADAAPRPRRRGDHGDHGDPATAGTMTGDSEQEVLQRIEARRRRPRRRLSKQRDACARRRRQRNGGADRDAVSAGRWKTICSRRSPTAR